MSMRGKIDPLLGTAEEAATKTASAVAAAEEGCGTSFCARTSALLALGSVLIGFGADFLANGDVSKEGEYTVLKFSTPYVDFSNVTAGNIGDNSVPIQTTTSYTEFSIRMLLWLGAMLMLAGLVYLILFAIAVLPMCSNGQSKRSIVSPDYYLPPFELLQGVYLSFLTPVVLFLFGHTSMQAGFLGPIAVSIFLAVTLYGARLQTSKRVKEDGTVVDPKSGTPMILFSGLVLPVFLGLVLTLGLWFSESKSVDVVSYTHFVLYALVMTLVWLPTALQGVRTTLYLLNGGKPVAAVPFDFGLQLALHLIAALFVSLVMFLFVKHTFYQKGVVWSPQ